MAHPGRFAGLNVLCRCSSALLIVAPSNGIARIAAFGSIADVDRRIRRRPAVRVKRLVVNAEWVVRFVARYGDLHVPLNPSPDVQEGVRMVPNSSVWRHLSLTGAIFALLSTMFVSTAAQAVGDTVLNHYLIADPLPSGKALPDSVMMALIASEEAQLDANIAGNGYVRLAMAAWVDSSTGEEVVSQLSVFTGATTIPSAVASATALAACPPAAGTTTPTVPVALIPASAEATCVSATTNLTEYVIAWSTNNVLAIVAVSGQTQSQAESIAVTQAALIPATVINLASKASYVVSRFATNSSALSTGMKLQISQDAIAISKMSPTSIKFTGHQSVKGDSRVNRQLAVGRVQAVYRYLVAQLKNLGVPSATLQAIGLGSGRPEFLVVKRGSPSSSLSVALTSNYLL
jgi:outer membrane protein OmpA-like peptidoglycan-associated protein